MRAICSLLTPSFRAGHAPRVPNARPLPLWARVLVALRGRA